MWGMEAVHCSEAEINTSQDNFQRRPKGKSTVSMGQWRGSRKINEQASIGTPYIIKAGQC